MKKTKTIFYIALFVAALGIALELGNGIGDPIPAEPLYIIGIAALIPSAIVLFFKPSAGPAWSRFAIWWSIISTLLIWVTPRTSGGWIPLFFAGKRDIQWGLGFLMLLVGLAITLWPRRR